MDSTRISIFLRAAVTGWIAVVMNCAVAFFLTPYVLHRLGDEAFGLWVLVTTVVGYSGVFDIGIRASLLRYVSRENALGERDAANKAVATAFYFFTAICVATILTTLLLAAWLPVFFSVRRDLLEPFRHLFLLAGLVQAVTFPLEIFVGAVQAAARCDQVYMLRVMSLILRVVFVITVLHAGGKLFGLGAAMLVPNVAYYCGHIPFALRVMPTMSVHPKWFRKSVLQNMLRYGWVSLTVGISEKLRDNIYPLIITKILTPAAVTLFSLPIKLLAFPVQGIGTMTEVLNPLSSQLEAHNDFPALRRLIQLTVQSAFLLLVPMAVFLIVFGKDLLSLWAGPQYHSAYPLLVLLTLGMGTAATQCCVQAMLFGISRHKGMIWFRFSEGLTIAVLGVVALRVWGLFGLALVAAITQLFINLVLIPRHLCRILELPLRTYLVEACLKPCLLAVPLSATLVAVRSFVIVDRWSTLLVVLLITILVFSLLVLLLMFASSTNTNRFSLEVLKTLEARFRIQKLKPGVAVPENV